MISLSLHAKSCPFINTHILKHFTLCTDCSLSWSSQNSKSVVLLCCTCESHTRFVTEPNKYAFHTCTSHGAAGNLPVSPANLLVKTHVVLWLQLLLFCIVRHAHTHGLTWCAGLAAYACRSEAKKLANQALQKAWYRQSSKHQPFSKRSAWSRGGSETASAAHAIAFQLQL